MPRRAEIIPSSFLGGVRCCSSHCFWSRGFRFHNIQMIRKLTSLPFYAVCFRHLVELQWLRALAGALTFCCNLTAAALKNATPEGCQSQRFLKKQFPLSHIIKPSLSPLPSLLMDAILQLPFFAAPATTVIGTACVTLVPLAVWLNCLLPNRSNSVSIPPPSEATYVSVHSGEVFIFYCGGFCFISSTGNLTLPLLLYKSLYSGQSDVRV